MLCHKNFGACTYVLFTLFTFALKMAVLNCDLTLEENTQAKLTVNLMDAVRSNWNRIISPALIQDSLIVAALGGKVGSNTQKELQLASQVSGSKFALARKLRQLSVVNLENYLYVNKRYPLEPLLRQRINFVNVSLANFKESDRITKKINALVARRTKHELQKDIHIVKQKNTDDDTTLIALNLINFSAQWSIPVLSSTNGSAQNSLYASGDILYGRVEELNVTAAVLPFKRSRARMLLLFGDESNKLLPLEDRLSHVDVTKIPSVLQYKPTGLFVPRFRFQTVYSLFTGTLEKMKVDEALTGKAQFNGFSGKVASYLRYFNQFSSIRIDTNGVHFASATNAQYEISSAYEKPKLKIQTQFVTDNVSENPFFFYIINGKNILAAGSSYNGKKN